MVTDGFSRTYLAVGILSDMRTQRRVKVWFRVSPDLTPCSATNVTESRRLRLILPV